MPEIPDNESFKSIDTASISVGLLLGSIDDIRKTGYMTHATVTEIKDKIAEHNERFIKIEKRLESLETKRSEGSDARRWWALASIMVISSFKDQIINFIQHMFK